MAVDGRMRTKMKTRKPPPKKRHRDQSEREKINCDIQQKLILGMPTERYDVKAFLASVRYTHRHTQTHT